MRTGKQKNRARRLANRRPGRKAVVEPSRVVARLRKLIAGRAGHPCPDNDVLADALGVNTHVIRDAIALLESRFQLEIQRTAHIGGPRRRMRVKVRGYWWKWTAYSKRGAYDLRIVSPDLQILAGVHGCAHHLLRVLQAGRFDSLPPEGEAKN